jgi:hypothetical protein
MAAIFLLFVVNIRLGGLPLLFLGFVVGLVHFVVVAQDASGFLFKAGSAPLGNKVFVPSDNRRVSDAQHIGNLLDGSVVGDRFGLLHVCSAGIHLISAM